MPNDSKRKRIGRARKKAEKDLAKMGFNVFRSGGYLLGFKETELKIVHVSLALMNGKTEMILRTLPSSPWCTKETWCRKFGESEFTIHKI